jgi:hypothetical protein
MKKLFVFILSFVLFSEIVWGQDDEVRIVFNPSIKLADDMDVYLRVIFPNVVAGPYPFSLTGPRFRFGESWLSIMFGKTFRPKDDTWKVAGFCVLKSGRFFLWNEVHYNTNWRNFTHLIMFRYTLLKNFSAGFDAETITGHGDKSYKIIGPALQLKFNDHFTAIVTYFWKWSPSRNYGFLKLYLIFQ